MASLDSCAIVSLGIVGKFVASQNGIKSEAIPKTEISAVKTWTGVGLKQPCRCLLASLYLLRLNSLDFIKFVSWQNVSSRTEMLDLSYSTISGLIVCLKTSRYGGMSKMEDRPPSTVPEICSNRSIAQSSQEFCCGALNSIQAATHNWTIGE